jgi:hypothetical protein
MMKKNKLKPLKNKNWLFPETGKEGFHYEDVFSAVAGFKNELQRKYAGSNEREIIIAIEKWFADVVDEDTYPSQMK